MEIKIQRLPLLLLFISVLCFNPIPTSGRTLSLVNGRRPLIALVMSYITEAETIGSSGEFVPSSKTPFVDLYDTFDLEQMFFEIKLKNNELSERLKILKRQQNLVHHRLRKIEEQLYHSQMLDQVSYSEAYNNLSVEIRRLGTDNIELKKDLKKKNRIIKRAADILNTSQ